MLLVANPAWLYTFGQLLNTIKIAWKLQIVYYVRKIHCTKCWKSKSMSEVCASWARCSCFWVHRESVFDAARALCERNVYTIETLWGCCWGAKAGIYYKTITVYLILFNFFQHYCEQHEGRLVHIENSLENDFIKEHARELKGNVYAM